MQRLQEIQGPTHELPPIDTSERQFSGRSRLYIGNIGPGVTEESLKTDLGKYGEVGEMFYNSEKHFAFLRMDYRENAEKDIHKDIRENYGKRMLHINESFQNIKGIKLYGWENKFIDKIENIYQEENNLRDTSEVRNKVYDFVGGCLH